MRAHNAAEAVYYSLPEMPQLPKLPQLPELHNLQQNVLLQMQNVRSTAVASAHDAYAILQVFFIFLSLPKTSKECSYEPTKMHSSRMRTARLLPVSPSRHCTGGMSAPRGCLLQGVSALEGAVYPTCTEADTPHPVNRMTDRCKNTTFANFVCGRQQLVGMFKHKYLMVITCKQIILLIVLTLPQV